MFENRNRALSLAMSPFLTPQSKHTHCCEVALLQGVHSEQPMQKVQIVKVTSEDQPCGLYGEGSRKDHVSTCMNVVRWDGKVHHLREVKHLMNRKL